MCVCVVVVVVFFFGGRKGKEGEGRGRKGKEGAANTNTTESLAKLHDAAEKKQTYFHKDLQKHNNTVPRM